MICPACKRDFPDSLVSEMAIGEGGKLRYELRCAVCALEATNKLAGLPADTPFRGPIARKMYDDCIEHLKVTGQNKDPEKT